MDENEIRQGLEEIRQKGEANNAADAERRVADRQRREREADRFAKDRRQHERRLEDERIASGASPMRMEFETEADWEARRDEWRTSPAGLSFMDRRRRERDADNARLWSVVVEEGGVPMMIADKVRSGDLSETDALKAAREFKGPILVLSGDIGVGKSIAAALWLLAPYLPGGEGRPPFTGGKRAPDLLWVSAARLSRWPRYDEDQMARLLKARRLVIDDLFTEYADAKGSFVATFDEVVNDRIGNGRPTVITTNATGEVFKDRYGDRIADRIREGRGFISLTGESLRRAPPRPVQQGLALVTADQKIPGGAA